MSLKNHISRAVFLLTCHFCFHCVAFEYPTISLSLPTPTRLPLCPTFALLKLPPSYPRGLWPGLIAVSIAHGFPLLLQPDFSSKRALFLGREQTSFPKHVAKITREQTYFLVDIHLIMFHFHSLYLNCLPHLKNYFNLHHSEESLLHQKS